MWVKRSSESLQRTIRSCALTGLLLSITGPVLAASQVGAPPDPGPAAVSGEVEPGTAWELPVQRPVVDRFRAPRTQWGAGNRGWEFATEEGDPVVAVGNGVIQFAGWVAGRGVVTLDHGSGLLSSVTGLAEVSVLRGQQVAGGHLLGRSMPGLHLGFRLHGRYIDPELLYSRPLHAVLVPLPPGT